MIGVVKSATLLAKSVLMVGNRVAQGIAFKLESSNRIERKSPTNSLANAHAEQVILKQVQATVQVKKILIFLIHNNIFIHIKHVSTHVSPAQEVHKQTALNVLEIEGIILRGLLLTKFVVVLQDFLIFLLPSVKVSYKNESQNL